MSSAEPPAGSGRRSTVRIESYVDGQLAKEPRKRGAIIGYGFIAEAHLAAVRARADAQVVAVVDGSPARQAAAARDIPGAVVRPELAALDDVALDFLVVCTPPSAHVAAIRYGLERGLGVLCEKPLVLSVDELALVVALQQASTGFLVPCHNYRFAPALAALVRAVAVHAGEAAVMTGVFRTERIGHARGVAEWRPDWRREPAISGGGLLQDHGPHSIYLAALLTASRPVRVGCWLEYPDAGPFRSTEERVRLRIEFASGSLIDVELDWTASARHTSYVAAGAWGEVRLVEDDLTVVVAAGTHTSHIQSDFNDPRHIGWFGGVWDEFLRAFDDPTIVAALQPAGFATVRVIHAAYESARLGGAWVAIDPG